MIPKFRVWIPNAQLLTEVLDIDFAGDGIITTRDANDFVVLFNEGELMQFTGLKDKYGKEIYEGDIVNLSVNNGFDYLKNEKSVVCNSKKQVGFVCKIGELEYRLFKKPVMGYEYKVIGNIYENKELLK